MPAAFTRKRERTEAEVKEEILNLLHIHEKQWYGILRSKLPEHYVEDAFGQVSLRLIEVLDQVDARTIKNPTAYIWRMCQNIAIDRLRKAATEARALVRYAALPQPAVEDDYKVLADERQRQMTLMGFLSKVLTERQLVAYVLRHGHDEELTGQEIARALNISYSLARKELSVAQKAVDEALDDPEVNQRLRDLLDDGR
ncbi:sigma-70 family RNA polymerase sigma factor [Streptomyces sp. NPDC000658]|uniref:RNA polymerase sigma factor n=1 Tax=Streptomyces sp. NPDC000658 TaxID=3154266 RepID=UPI0033255F94